MMFPEVPESQVPKKPKNIKTIKEKTMVDVTYGRGLSALWKYIYALPGIVTSLIIFIYYKPPLNIIGVVCGFSITTYLIFFAYRRKLVQKSASLRVFSVFIILYTFFGLFLWLMLFAR